KPHVSSAVWQISQGRANATLGYPNLHMGSPCRSVPHGHGAAGRHSLDRNGLVAETELFDPDKHTCRFPTWFIRAWWMRCNIHKTGTHTASSHWTAGSYSIRPGD